MKKVFFGAALILIMSLFLAGCGDSEEDNLGGTVENGSSENDTESNTEDNEEEDTEENKINEVIVDDENYKATLLEIVKKEDEIFGSSIEIVFEIENKLDKTITVQARDVSADGYMVDETILVMSQDVVGGKKAKAVLSIEDFDGYDFPELEEDLEMVLHVLDEETYDSIGEHEVNITF